MYHAEESRRENLIGSWLRVERGRRGLSQKVLCQRLQAYGVKVSPGALSKWETGEHMPSPYQLHALCLTLDAQNPFAALSGPALNEEGIRKVNEYVDDLRATGRYRPRRMVAMKIYSLPVSAGTGLMLESEDFETVSVPEEEVPAGAAFGVHVRGDSMTPRFTDGQIVWLRPEADLRDGEIGVFVLDGEAFLKQLRHSAPTPAERALWGGAPVAELVSLNPAYPPIRVRPEQRLEVAGRVVEG